MTVRIVTFAPASRAKAKAFSTATEDTGDPSVGMRMWLNMTFPFVGAIVLAGECALAFGRTKREQLIENTTTSLQQINGETAMPTAAPSSAVGIVRGAIGQRCKTVCRFCSHHPQNRL